jgi:hypothetical protein
MRQPDSKRPARSRTRTCGTDEARGTGVSDPPESGWGQGYPTQGGVAHAPTTLLPPAAGGTPRRPVPATAAWLRTPNLHADNE